MSTELPRLINLDHLRTAVSSIKEYTNNTFTTLDYVNMTVAELEERIIESSFREHIHGSNEITRMVDYTIADDKSDIIPADSLNAAIGKLEYKVNNAADSIHSHDLVYLKIDGTAAKAKQLENSISLKLIGDVTGLMDFDGSSDVTINTSISNITSDKITLKNYSKPMDTSAIEPNDSINAAIGKLEAALELSPSANIVEEMKAYVNQQLTQLIGGSDIPDSLNTLREISAAINDDPNYHSTVSLLFDTKSDKQHTHDVVTDLKDGFMSYDDKIKLDSVEHNANHYTHPTNSGFKHIPSGGELGQYLAWADDGVAEWKEIILNTYATDTEVNELLDEIFPI